MFDASPTSDFETAARAALKLLHQRLGFKLWMVTRTEGDDWIVLHTEDHGYGIDEKTVLRWADSFCSRMIRGEGPRVAPRSGDIDVYAAAPIGQQVAIGAYVGVPLNRPDGSLFGTLCAIDPAAQPDDILREQPLVELIAQMLSGILKADLMATGQTRRAERAEAQALADPLTGLYNRRGWDKLTQAEEARCQHDCSPACVLSIDLDGLKAINDSEGHATGDSVLKATADALRAATQDPDIVARVGGDEFLLLGVGCNAAGADALLERVESALMAAEIDASVGLAPRTPEGGISGATQQADAAMYQSKRERNSDSAA